MSRFVVRVGLVVTALAGCANGDLDFTPDRATADAGAPGTDAGATAPVDAGTTKDAAVVTVDASDAQVASGAPCLLVSEYVEGSASNKALEIWNCGKSSLALSEYGLCLASNKTTSGCTSTAMLSGTLAPGAVVVVCGTSFSHAACTSQNAVVNFNGDDRIALLHDDDASSTIDRARDSIVDSFGDLGALPGGSPWEDKTLRRSTCSAYRGGGTFDYTRAYVASAVDDFSDLGKAPTVACP